MKIAMFAPFKEYHGNHKVFQEFKYMILGDVVSKLKTFVWILNHISRSITWSLFILKASYINMVFDIVVSVYRLAKILKLAPVP